ncbi:hypothetical protein [Bradyrhizobium sp. LTSPM299]|uniref:hypothetical protein n=1 Tax=Bradyrhizobium sp. LTSPM299 TaxID=1619233 RepID=UPI000A8DDB9B|nr:hypothetical protein [Bradyrhizobium sp. LTSPM299]
MIGAVRWKFLCYKQIIYGRGKTYNSVERDLSLFGKKPETLREVVRRVGTGEQKFDPSLREFLDSFYVNINSRQQAIDQRPASIDAVHDAYVAAVAEHLARVYGLAIPEWSETHGNGLREPFFAGGLQSFKGVLVAESPTAFRRRLLFVSKDALSRPRM